MASLAKFCFLLCLAILPIQTSGRTFPDLLLRYHDRNDDTSSMVKRQHLSDEDSSSELDDEIDDSLPVQFYNHQNPKRKTDGNLQRNGLKAGNRKFQTQGCPYNVVKETDKQNNFEFPEFSSCYSSVSLEKYRIMAERYAFYAQWFDDKPKIFRTFQFLYYPKDSTVEMVEVQPVKRVFLRRIFCDTIDIGDLFIGNTVCVLSRQLVITNYADEVTKNLLSTMSQRSLVLILSKGLDKLGSHLQSLISIGLKITKLKMLLMAESDARRFASTLRMEEYKINSFMEAITNGSIVAVEVLGKDSVAAAKEIFQSEISGDEGIFNQTVFCSEGQFTEEELGLFFDPVTAIGKPSALLDRCTCCIVKPHAVKAGLFGNIITAIQEADFNITALQLFHLDIRSADEFMEVYRGVLPEYSALVNQLALGPCIAMEITASQSQRSDIVAEFRELVGPYDPVLAELLQPQTLRARFGKDKVCNAVHCTDMSEDGRMEVAYFFNSKTLRN